MSTVLQVIALLAYIGASGTVARDVYKRAEAEPYSYTKGWAITAAAFAFVIAPALIAGFVTHRYMES